jgi:hypothetical protein
VVSYAGNGTVYAFKPGVRDDDITLLTAVPAAPRPGLTPVLPVDYWRNENDFIETIAVTQPYQFVSPDGTTFLPAGTDFVTGELYYGSKLNNTLRAFGFAPAVAGQPYYVSDENGEKTYAAIVEPDGTLSDLKLFTEQGGESVAVDDKGNVILLPVRFLYTTRRAICSIPSTFRNGRRNCCSEAVTAIHCSFSHAPLYMPCKPLIKSVEEIDGSLSGHRILSYVRHS